MDGAMHRAVCIRCHAGCGQGDTDEAVTGHDLRELILAPSLRPVRPDGKHHEPVLGVGVPARFMPPAYPLEHSNDHYHSLSGQQLATLYEPLERFYTRRIPTAHDVARRMAEKVGGFAGGTYLDALNIPLTAHFIGGCPIGDSAQSGVIDPYQRVYGHPGLHVVDGSAITANLGVNPSFTITAQAERAMAFWPNNGERDPRPDLGGPTNASRPCGPNIRRFRTVHPGRYGCRCRRPELSGIPSFRPPG